MLKEIIFGGSIALSLVAGLHSQEKYNPDRANEYTNKLEINTKNKTRKITNISEIEGITQIKEFTENSAFEESWLFYPSKKVWKETGYGETGWTDETYPQNKTFIDSLFLMKEVETTRMIISYHFHTIKGYPDPKETGLEIDRYMASMWSDEMIESAIYLGNTVPSLPDMMKAIIIQKRFPERDEGDIRHKIVSFLGVTEYGFTQKGIQMIREGKSSELKKKIIYDHTTLARYVIFKNAEAYLDGEKVLDTKEYSRYNSRELLKAWRDEYMNIKFTPFDELGIKE